LSALGGPSPVPDVVSSVPSGDARGRFDRKGDVGDRMERLLEGLGLRSRLSRDVALAIVVAVLSVTLTLVVFSSLGEDLSVSIALTQTVIAIALVAAQSLILVFRRRSPVWCLGLTAMIQVALVVVIPGEGLLRGMASAIAAYTVGAYLPLRWAVPAISGITTLEIVLGAVSGVFLAPSVQTALNGAAEIPVAQPDLLSTFGQFVIPPLANNAIFGLIGWVVASRREYIALVKLRADELVRDQKARADAATAAERTRMAREVHDIAAHHLSGIVVQAAAVERLILTDPEAARETTRWIRTQGRETLANLRFAVGMLRDGAGDTDDGRSPVPGLDVAPALVENERALGTRASMVVRGSRFALGPFAEHSPGAVVAVSLDYSDSGLALEVTNGRPAPARTSAPHDTRAAGSNSREHRGLGLIGMRERAELIGAALDVGPTPEGGWSVTLTLPSGSGEAGQTGDVAPDVMGAP
jgi:signal transduction histidine kinase